MNWLKKAGQVIANVVGIVSGVGPIFAAAIPGTKDDAAIKRVQDGLTEVAQWVTITEGMFASVQQSTGLEKLNAATAFVAQVIQRAEFMAGKEIMDEARFAAAVRGITSNVADLLSSLKPKDLEVKK